MGTWILPVFTLVYGLGLGAAILPICFWTGLLFLVGLWVYFRNLAIGRFWILLVGSIGLFFGVWKGEGLVNGPTFSGPPLDQITLTGHLIRPPVIKNERYLSYFKSSPYNFVVRQKLTETPLSYGVTYQVTGTIIPPKTPTNPGQFNQALYFKKKGITGTLKLKSAQKLRPRFKNPLYELTDKLRQWIHTLHRQTLPKRFADLYIGLLFGDYGLSLDPKLSQDFKKLGLIHLLVVSGSQVALVTGAILAILRQFNVSPSTSFWIIGGINIFFFILTGGGPSIGRAILMTQMAIGLIAIKRRTSPIHILCVTACLMMLITPRSVFDAGAHLSFIATSSLLFGAPIIQQWFSVQIPSFIRVLLGICLAPFICTFPLVWALTDQISWISPLTNLLVINGIEVLVLVGFLATPLGLVAPSLTALINQFAYGVMIALEWIVSFFSELPLGQLNLKTPPLALILTTYGILTWLALGNPRHRHLAAYSLTLTLGASFIWAIWPIHTLQLVVLDVGQGDSTILRTPKNQAILIDGGPLVKDFRTGKTLFDAGSKIVEPALRSMGINRLNKVILTHDHLDHAGGLRSLAKNLQLDQFIAPIFISPKTQHTLPKLIPARHLYARPIMIEKNVTLRVLHPNPKTRRSKNLNDHSVVIQLIFEKFRFLLTGDLEQKGEQQLVRQFGPGLRSTVLKLGHHGSKTSSTSRFLNHVQPKIGVISCGQNNKFGHPHPQILDRLKKAGIQVYRTDHDGAILIEATDQSISVKRGKDLFN